ncbi:hypothetical protein ACFPPD_13755 [Cohnella suwonensis]|uniref:Lipoprotein n=1 Tax=Cohnella suwonensis TaxID=696072 RepID=A0ABW0LVK6_9BACL
MNRLLIAYMFLISIILLSACADEAEEKSPSVDPYLVVEISKPNLPDNGYDVYKTIKGTAQASAIRDILVLADNSRSSVSMARQPDRKITMHSAYPTASSEPIPYGVWLSPDRATVEIVNEFGGGYVSLSPDHSRLIREILD